LNYLAKYANNLNGPFTDQLCDYPAYGQYFCWKIF